MPVIKIIKNVKKTKIFNSVFSLIKQYTVRNIRIDKITIVKIKVSKRNCEPVRMPSESIMANFKAGILLNVFMKSEISSAKYL